MSLLYSEEGEAWSTWHRSYSASNLRPYLKTAAVWIKANHAEHFFVRSALAGLGDLLTNAGHAEIATRLRGLSAEQRARIAFARLRDADIKSERILSIYLAVCALIEEDAGSHRVREFRIVQVAKACHRLASGYHRHWDFPLANGKLAPVSLHAYPRSSGRVLRLIGAAIESVCEIAASRHLESVLALKKERFGAHPSTLPGWIPEWQRELTKARAKQARSIW